MSAQLDNERVCIVIGASHAGVNFAFALRREGWQGKILLIDTDPALPYHRPPLSKTFLTSDDKIEAHVLRSAESYEKAQIRLILGKKVTSIHLEQKSIVLEGGSRLSYDKLVLATGARPLVPPIKGIDKLNRVFVIRTASDATHIRNTYREMKSRRVVIIGGGYIGLETAASLKKLGAEVVVLERENRVLARVTAPELSAFYQKLHKEKGVHIYCSKNVHAVEKTDELHTVICDDGTQYAADMIVLGCGIRVNTELADSAGLAIENGIKVDASMRTSDEHIYAIGDCTFHYNPHYDRFVRLESVQNAVEQAKVAASVICGKDSIYNSIPWFWSDQYDVKLQIVGLSAGYDEVLVRKEGDEEVPFSIWYFKGDRLIAVEAVNHPKAYVLGTKFIKSGQKLDKSKLADVSIPFKPDQFFQN